jgi:hypothetical protein
LCYQTFESIGILRGLDGHARWCVDHERLLLDGTGSWCFDGRWIFSTTTASQNSNPEQSEARAKLHFVH